MNEVSRDLIVNSNSKTKQALLVLLALYTLATLIFIYDFIFLVFALEDLCEPFILYRRPL
jgi:hypothetical protein